MARIVNYSSLSKLAKRRVAEAGYTPDPGGKTASRKSNSGSSKKEVNEEQLQTYTAKMEAPAQTPAIPEKRQISGTAGSPAGDIKQQYTQGDISMAEANRHLQALKNADTKRTKEEESFRAQERRIDRITKTEEKLYKADQWVEGKVKKVISGKGYVSGVGVAASMLPYRMTAGFGGDVYVAGMKTGAASEGLVKNTSGTLKAAGSAAVQTPRVMASGFDPRKPEGLVNIATVAALTRAGKGYKPRIAENIGKGKVETVYFKTKSGKDARMTRTETKTSIIEEGFTRSPSGVTETATRITPKPQEPAVPFRKRASDGFRKAGERTRAAGRDAANMFKDTARNIKDRFKPKPKDRAKASKDLQKTSRDIMRPRPEKPRWLVPRKNPIVPRRPSYPITRPTPNRPPQFDITFKPPGDIVPKQYPIEPSKPKVPDIIRPKPKDIMKPDERIYKRVDKPVDKPSGGGGGLPPFGSFGLDLGGGGGLNPTWRSRKGGKRARAKSYLPSQAALTFNIRGKRSGTGTGLEFRPITK